MTRVEWLRRREAVLLAYCKGEITLDEATRQIDLVDYRRTAPSVTEGESHDHRPQADRAHR